MAEKNSETDVLFKRISPILEKLGYSEGNKKEIEHEKPLQIGRSKYVYPDIVVNIKETPVFVLDAKNPEENLDLYERQIISYGLLLKTPYSVLCNGVTLKVYETQTEKVIWDKPIDKIPIFLSKVNLTKKITKTISTISEEKIEEAKKTLLVFEGIKEFSSLLYKCEDVIRDIDGLTGADAFDEISKLLFTKMYFEKMALETNKNLFSIENIKQNGGANYVKTYLFKTARDSNKDIFQGDETITLENSSIEKIVELLQRYALIRTDVDVKGRAFEIFLGKTFTGGLGQFFTPRTIVRFAVLFADPEINSPLERKNPYLVLDPACGSGGFLIEVFKAINEKIKNQPRNKQEELFERLSKHQLYGVDINPRLVRVSKMNMVLHGDGHGGIYKNSGLEDVNDDVKEETFDLVITNPPFGNRDKGKILEKFDFGKRKGKILKEQLREVLYVERCIKLLKKGGELAILLPDGILNNEQLNYVRDFIKKETIIKAVISLPDKAFKASGANSKTSLLFLKRKVTGKEEQQPIFMAMAEEVGFERKTKKAKEIEQNDLPSILKTYKDYKSGKLYENIKDKKDVLEILNDKPSCFLIGERYLGDRIDATYYFSKYVLDLGVPSCEVQNVARLSRVIVNPQQEPTKEIKYVQFSHIEKRLGDITGYFELLGREAPSRAKQLVNDGDLICARVKDSEDNVAIIPNELNYGIVSTGFVVLKPLAPMTSEALFALLRLRTTLNQVRWKSSGTIMPAINDDEYLSIKIPKLSKSEIDRITKEIKEVNRQRENIKERLSNLSEKLG
ncbi:N-6 DNA methylase [Candidatus Pacearchaeota archaeon]|nr:N-6 DNA methylase [Candidatus Pacearchaeota archaeon]